VSQSLDEARPIRDPSYRIERTDASVADNRTTRNEEYVPLQPLSEQERSVWISTAQSSGRVAVANVEMGTCPTTL